jgi:CheY-like chemotaxis protein
MTGRILYIEDNDYNFYLVNFILTAKGFEVQRAVDGTEGIAKAESGWPDLILLDIQLPVMDGYAVARAIRANVSLARIPIIAVTSFAMSGDREKALESGCTGYIEKPINPVSFASEVEAFLPVGGPR